MKEKEQKHCNVVIMLSTPQASSFTTHLYTYRVAMMQVAKRGLAMHSLFECESIKLKEREREKRKIYTSVERID